MNNNYYPIMNEICIQHHGILGQKWGVKNGPPYPLNGGDYTREETERVTKARKKSNSIYNKKHFDTVIKSGTELSTLSYDPDRTKKGDMFYATYKPLDKHQYNAMFNKPVKDIENRSVLKYRIKNVAKNDMKVASEDSASKCFLKLYKNDRDFYNFICDEDRMQKYFVDDKYKFKGYRDAKKSLDRLRESEKPAQTDVTNVYRLFNYVIPYDADKRGGHDVAIQRNKFFKALKESGYSALLDTNDSIYGGFKATAPVIVFDQSSVLLKGADRTTVTSKRFSGMVTVGRKILGL